MNNNKTPRGQRSWEVYFTFLLQIDSSHLVWCVTKSCSELQCLRCNVLQCVAVCCSLAQDLSVQGNVLDLFCEKYQNATWIICVFQTTQEVISTTSHLVSLVSWVWALLCKSIALFLFVAMGHFSLYCDWCCFHIAQEIVWKLWWKLYLLDKLVCEKAEVVYGKQTYCGHFR